MAALDAAAGAHFCLRPDFWLRPDALYTRCNSCPGVRCATTTNTTGSARPSRRLSPPTSSSTAKRPRIFWNGGVRSEGTEEEVGEEDGEEGDEKD